MRPTSGCGRTAPYVHFDLFDFGEQETATASGTDPRFEAEFRFGVDLDGRLSKYLQSTVLRFSVLDENEEDASGLLGYADLPLADLLTSHHLDETLPLRDARGEPAGSLTVVMALRDAPPPSAVSLRAPAERSEADAAAATIQSAYRGRGGGKAGAAGASEAAAADDGPGALRVDVRSLSLPEALRGGESVESVWVEVELLELDPGAARD